jgi:uncharacterized protein (TIGR03032 family)
VAGVARGAIVARFLVEECAVSSPSPAGGDRVVRYEHSRDFVSLLQHEKISLLVSTYQAGKLVVLGTTSAGLSLSFHNFEKATGVAVHPRQLAVGAKTAIWMLASAPEVTAALRHERQCDASYLARAAHVTDDIGIHELQWCGDELWFVNTRFSCLCTPSDAFSFVPRWTPPFISGLAAEDRCHLNGLCLSDGRPRFVTAMSETDVPDGWRDVKTQGGCIIDVASGETVARGFCMPHSPRLYANRLWVLDSGNGRLVVVDPQTGARETVTQQPGYLRGLDFAGPLAFIGLSRIRETSVFGGIPIAEQRDALKCAVVVIDVRSGKRVAYFEFLAGVEELFDVRVMPGVLNPLISGPWAAVEGAQPIWYVPVKESVATRLPQDPASQLVPEQIAFTTVPSGMPAPAVIASRQGLACVAQDDFVEAVSCFEQAVSVAPQSAAALSNLGLALQFVGRLEDSRARLERAVQAAPDAPQHHVNLAATLFMLGCLSEGWTQYEWRWKRLENRGYVEPFVDWAPPWNGSSLAQQTVLVYGEQGIGDEIMFASCYPDVIEQARRCVLVCDHRLVSLLRRSFPTAVVLAREVAVQATAREAIGPVDAQVAAGSLPRYVRTTMDDFPRDESFLVPDQQLVCRWRERYAQLGPPLTVGLSWRGGKGEEQRRRSATLEQLADLFTVPGVAFINLQYGPSHGEVTSFSAAHGCELHQWPDSDPLRDMDDFAAQIAALDLVMSVDNSTIHLAGSLGVPTVALLSFPSASYWRWFGQGEETVWYRRLRLLRRRHPGPWDAVVAAARDALAEMRGR